MSTESLHDWTLVSQDWWQLSYNDLSWAYRRRYRWTQSGGKAAIHPRPPFYHDQLYVDKDQWQSGVESVTWSETTELDLNPDLVGVRGALSMSSPYEESVGMSARPTYSTTQEEPLPFAGELEQVESATRQRNWDDLVRDLMGGTLTRSNYYPFDGVDVSTKLWDLNLLDDSKYDSHEFVDHTDSEMSTDSDPMPATPHGDKKSYAAVVFGGHALQSVVAPSPSKPLNATAIDFIPGHMSSPPESSPSPDTSGTPCTSLGFEHDTSPTKPGTSRSGAKSLPPKLWKDGEGFYMTSNDVTSSPPSVVRSHTSTRTATPKGRPTALFPAFITESSSSPRTRPSKTRELVDRLRSDTASEEASRKARKPEPDTTPAVVDDQPQSKAHDTESSQDKMAAIDGWITNVIATEEARVLANKDGWIEGTAAPSKPIRVVKNKKGHKRSSSSVNSTYPMTPPSTSTSVSTYPSPASSLTSFGLPVTPTSTSFPPSSYYSYPSSYANVQAAYMQLQMQAHAQAQAQWQMQMSSMLAPSYPMYQRVIPAYSVPQAIPVYEGGKITGNSGIRHV